MTNRKHPEFTLSLCPQLLDRLNARLEEEAHDDHSSVDPDALHQLEEKVADARFAAIWLREEADLSLDAREVEALASFLDAPSSDTLSVIRVQLEEDLAAAS